jgi:anti-anti-sigma factor
VTGSINVGDSDGTHIIRFEGDVRVGLCNAFDNYCQSMLGDVNFCAVIVDLTATKVIDSTALGSLAKLSLGVKALKGHVPTLICNSPNIQRILQNMGFDDVFAIVSDVENCAFELQTLPALSDLAVDGTRDKVIEAHRLLMSMNDANKTAFKQLVDALELEAVEQTRSSWD